MHFITSIFERFLLGDVAKKSQIDCKTRKTDKSTHESGCHRDFAKSCFNSSEYNRRQGGNSEEEN